MTAVELLTRLRALNVKVWAEGTRLRASAPKGVLTTELKAALDAHKAEVLGLLASFRDGPDAAAPPLAPRPRTGPLPLSFSQERLWVLDQLQPHSPAYVLVASQRLHGPLDMAVLRRTVDEVVRRHDALRTCFPRVNGRPVQLIAPPGPVSIDHADLCALPEGQRAAAARRIVREAAERPFDLARGPLMRAMVVRLDPEEHLLLLTMHHIITDQWSLGVLSGELAALYHAFSAGEPSPLPEPAVQYADFACWQRDWLAGPVLESQLAYWRACLTPLPPVLELPTDRPRRAVPSFRGGRHDFVLSSSLTERLRALSREAGTTLFMTLLAAFKALLSRHTGQEDVVVGTPVANRTRVELEGVIGFFANSLVLRTSLAGRPAFRELLARVREVALGAFTHQDLPFEKLVEAVHPERTLSHNPLFQVMFALENAPAESAFDVDTLASPLDLTLFVWEDAEQLAGSFAYMTDLFEASTIERLADRFAILLEAVVADPDSPVAELPILTAEERRLLLSDWNATSTSYPRDSCIHQLFEALADATPEAVAAVFGDARLTYRELDRHANRLAHRLRSLGVGREALVGVVMDRSLEVLVALLGILKAGAAYVPLDPAWPAERKATVLEDARISVIVTHDRLTSELRGLPHTARIVGLEPSSQAIDPDDEARPRSGASADNLAYVMYTSGSTGRPKGVCVPHRAVVRLVRGTDYVRLGASEVLLQLAPLSFDAATFEIWGSLLNGGMLALAPPGVLSPHELGEILRRHGVTTLWLSAGLFHQVVEHALQVLQPVRQLLVGGDVLSVPHVRRALAELPGCRVINGYGPTENTTFTTAHPMASSDDVGRTVSIGRPIANTRVYILDPHWQLAPIGVAGELCVAGDGLARGYLSRPDLTAASFIPAPPGERRGERLYRTGDMARYLPDGRIEFLGRTDRQVKVRGFRIELEEVETLLGHHPAIRQVVVVAEPDASGDKRLVAYVVASRDERPGGEELRDFVARKVPEYMIPSAFVMLDQMPLTANGKVDRDALPAVTTRPPIPFRLDSQARAPSDALEREMVRIWEATLGVREIELDDNFFDLGGTSLLAVALFARIEEAFGEPLPLATLFQAPTVSELARAIRERSRLPRETGLAPIRHGGDRLPIFAVPGIGGDSVTYVDLARHLGDEQPFYGLQARGLDGRTAPFTRLPDMAAHYLEQVRTQQPSGPYALLGTCMGGVVAFEMAQQLTARGERVRLLALLDTWPPVPAGRWPAILPSSRSVAVARFLVGRLSLHLRALATLGDRERRGYVATKATTIGRKLVRRDPLRGNWGEIHQDLVRHANYWALQQYVPRAYAGAIVLFVAADRELLSVQDDRLAWRELATGGLEVYTVPGRDSGLMLKEPNVRILATQLAACLRRASAAHSPAPTLAT